MFWDIAESSYLNILECKEVLCNVECKEVF